MTRLENILNENKKFVEKTEKIDLPHNPQKELAIFSCMDCRLIDFLTPALGLKRGDAKVITNAGNKIVDDEPIRSLAVAIHALGAKEVLVVGHTECGMANVDIESLKSKMLENGISQDDIDQFDLGEWIGSFDSEEENVIASCSKIKNHPLIPDIPVHGLIIDIVTGELKVLVEDY